MVGSTFAYGVLQSIGGLQGNEEQGISLPKESVIDYRLSAEQQRYAIRMGKTTAEFEYSLRCKNCTVVKAQTESLVSQLQDQVILSEIVVDDRLGLPVVRLESSYGRETLESADMDQIVNSLCSILVEPPLWCVRRSV